MSLILDALNKAQREREEQREPIPQLSTVHYTPPAPAAAPRRQYWVGSVAIVLVAAVSASLGLWLSSDEPVTSVPATAGMAAPAMPAPAPEPAPEIETPVPTTEATKPEPVPVASAPARVQTQAVTLSLPEPAAASQDEVASLYQAEEVSQPAVQTPAKQELESAVPAPATLAKAEEPAPAPAVRDSLAMWDVPYVHDLSGVLQQKLPSLIYGRHQYDAEASARFVELNGMKYRAGSQVANGLVLEEILSDGIVLRYQNERFKLRALNSWVNL